MLWFRTLDDSTEGFQNWEFMTTHCWGEQAAGEWTLKIQDTPSQTRDSTELGLLFLFLTSQYYETYTEVHLEQQLKYSAGLPGQTFYLALFLSVCCVIGALKQWSLVIYGTAEQPYPMHRQRARSAEMPMDSDLTEEYNGESCTQLVSSSSSDTKQLNALQCRFTVGISSDRLHVKMEFYQQSE